MQNKGYVVMGVIVGLLIILCLVKLITLQEDLNNERNTSINAIHKDTTERNKLQTETNKLISDLIKVHGEPMLIECED